MFALQLVYASSFWSADHIHLAAKICNHYVTSNLLFVGFIHFWVRSNFWIAESLLILNFFNLTFTYFCHGDLMRTTPRKMNTFIFISTITGPLAWSFVTIYWTGAAAIHSTHPVSRIAANVVIWGWGGYAVFYLAAYRDFAMGFALSTLCFCKLFTSTYRELFNEANTS